MKTIIAAAALLVISMQAPQRLEQVMLGNWSGTLEYRDYRSDRRVTLPTTLTIDSSGPGVLTFAYVYDDGPGKVVTERDRITIDSAKSTYRVQSGDGKYDTTFAATGLAEFSAASTTITLIGRGEENDVAVDVRTTIELTSSSLTMLRESRQPGAGWLFRHRYALAR